jgi:DNA-binding transcriptional regulator GbsR (MarR family)
MKDLELRVLNRAIAAHPKKLTTSELARRVKASKEDVCSVVRSLQKVALLVPGDEVGATRAALSYREIIRAR